MVAAAGGFCVGVFTGGINIAFFEALFETTLPDRRPSFAALNAVFANLATFVGPLLGSLLLDAIGLTASFLTATALHLIGAALCWWMGVGRRSLVQPAVAG